MVAAADPLAEPPLEFQESQNQNQDEEEKNSPPPEEEDLGISPLLAIQPRQVIAETQAKPLIDEQISNSAIK